MDGNGRWASNKLLPRHLGHKEGIKRVKEIAYACLDFGIECMTVYAFSTENWNRPKNEIDHLFSYFEEFFKNNKDEFNKKDIQVRFMGDTSKLRKSTQVCIEEIKELTKNNRRLILNICLNYGGRQEIVRACKKIAIDYKNEKIDINNIDINVIKDYLDSSNLPEVDLLIRTSGEQRISNFLLYQLAYSEFIFTSTYWPDFNKDELIKCLEEYQNRNRRFGKIK
jgi:undecaprenyl diphosphate synthase